MTTSRALAFVAAFALGTQPTWARSISATASGNMPLVALEDDSTASTQVNAFYYSQLVVEAAGFNFPQGESERKNLGKSLLEALGLRKETRSVIVTLSIIGDSVVYPEIPVLAYQFDGAKKLTNIILAQRKTLSLQRLPANGHYSVTLKYRYSLQNEFDVKGPADAIAALIPGSTVANVVTEPLFAGLGKLAAQMFSLAGSADTSFSISDEMSPYQGKHNRLIATLRRPNGSDFGTVTLSLEATPLIARVAQGDLSKLAQTDFRKSDFEDPRSFSLTIGGTRRSLLGEVKGVKEFSDLAANKSISAVRSFCSAASTKLDQELNLTPMERVLLVHQALTDTGFGQKPNEWYFACFSEADRNWLKLAIGLDPSPTADDDAGALLNVTRNAKYALGCLITNQTGNDCDINAPDPRGMLLILLAPQVEIGQLELAGIIDPSSLPADRKVERDLLITTLKGKAGRFGCFSQGLLLQNADGSASYQVRGKVQDSRITRLDIVAVPRDAFGCT